MRNRAILAVLVALTHSGCFLVGYDPELKPVSRDAGQLPGWSLDGSQTGADAGNGSGTLHHDSSTPGRDASLWDSGSPGPVDSGSNVDGSQNHHDAGHSPDGGHSHPGDAGNPGLDASLHDGGAVPLDSGTHLDGSTIHLDAGSGFHDAGSWWIGVTPTNACTSSLSCGQTCTTAASPCVFDCSAASCTPTCQAGTTCHTGCSKNASCVTSCGTNANCVNQCSSISCASTCAAGSTCDLECSGAASCNLTCSKGAHCVAHCSGVCTMNCSGVPLSCPNGVLTCDHPCP